MVQEATPPAMAWLLSGRAIGKKMLTDLSAHFTNWLVQLSRAQVKQVIALNTGHGHFRKHVHTLGIRNNSLECRLCNQFIETDKHIMYWIGRLRAREGVCLVVSNQVMDHALVLIIKASEPCKGLGDWLSQLLDKGRTICFRLT